ncbi:isochorismatase family cysteine hydrolase [Enterococcus sp. AZ196]|uniref:isochorismatase family cysteine hydrolase n=1 Tax=Enterococcus sp. AZ196 TaxID=2774659 RepID=UPI003D27EF02
MLVIVDMQNRILDANDKNHVPGADFLIPKLQQRLKKARESGEMVLFTRDIPIEHKNESEELFGLQIIDELAPLSDEYVFKKNYYALPPESLIQVRELTAERKQEKSQIEVAGVELSVCVLANTLALQGALPEGNFSIDSDLVAGNHLNEATLSLLKEFNIECK